MEIVKGIEVKPQIIMLSGVPGVGKSTFAANAPDAIFIQLEEGVSHLDVHKTKLLSSWTEFKDALRWLSVSEHSYRWIVIDTATRLQDLIDAHVCAENGVDTLSKIPYGKGPAFTQPYWLEVMKMLRHLRDNRGLNTMLVSHVELKPCQDPETETYDKYGPALHKNVSAFMVQECDAVLFARYHVRTKEVDKGFNRTEVKAIRNAPRVLRCCDSPTAIAKNRFGMPDEIALDWNEFSSFLPKGV